MMTYAPGASSQSSPLEIAITPPCGIAAHSHTTAEERRGGVDFDLRRVGAPRRRRLSFSLVDLQGISMPRFSTFFMSLRDEAALHPSTWPDNSQ